MTKPFELYIQIAEHLETGMRGYSVSEKPHPSFTNRFVFGPHYEELKQQNEMLQREIDRLNERSNYQALSRKNKELEARVKKLEAQ